MDWLYVRWAMLGVAIYFAVTITLLLLNYTGLVTVVRPSGAGYEDWFR